MYKDLLTKLIAENITVTLSDKVQVTYPTHLEHGDYTTNIAMVLASHEGKNSRKVAQSLKEAVLKKEANIIEKIDIAGPGFMNFFLTTEARNSGLLKELQTVVTEGKDYGKGIWGAGKRVVVEYSSPNIAKSFSMGHLRSTIIGQAIYNLYQFAGWECIGDNHLGDWGTQFGMLIAAVEEHNFDISNTNVHELEKLYIDFNKRIETHPELYDKAREAFARLEYGEEKARKVWQQAKNISLKEFRKIYDRLKVNIDNEYGESYYEHIMPDVIREAKEKGVARESQGAWIVEFPAMPPAMLLKSNGTTTYFTRDLATIKFRLQGGEYPKNSEKPNMKADFYVYEVGAEQTLHFRQVFETVEMLGWAKKERFIHVAHGLIRLPEGKMSTRKGRTIKLEEVLDLVGGKAQKMALSTVYKKHIPKTKTGTVAVDYTDLSKVGIGAVKYNELKHSPKLDYVFQWDEALNMQGDSGPYIQYACVRGRSVLAKAEEERLTSVASGDPSEEEKAVALYISRFGEVIEQSARSFTPNTLCTYLFELAQRFNTFYQKHRIIQEVNQNKRSFRLLLTKATIQVLENGLYILGIAVPSQM